MSEKQVEIIAHRGASGLAPENTLAAMQLAIDIGVDWIELDVRQTLDRVLVCVHDETLNRTTTGKGHVITLNYKKIKQFDAGSWFSPEFSEERIPSLNEVLKLINGQCKLLIEVKGTQLLQYKIAENLLTLIKKHNAEKWVVIQSFNSDFLKKAYRLNPALKFNNLVNYSPSNMPIYIDRRIKLGNIFRLNYSEAVNPNYKKVTKKLIEKVKKHNRKIFCWTVDDPDEMQRLIELGVDGIITNFPNRLRDLLARIEETTISPD
jgi:glycerophosphoryl diester phosphodiesterase